MTSRWGIYYMTFKAGCFEDGPPLRGTCRVSYFLRLRLIIRALCLQIGEIKKGLKALKATGVTPEDYERHVMFVQVSLQFQPPFLHFNSTFVLLYCCIISVVYSSLFMYSAAALPSCTRNYHRRPS